MCTVFVLVNIIQTNLLKAQTIDILKKQAKDGEDRIDGQAQEIILLRDQLVSNMQVSAIYYKCNTPTNNSNGLLICINLSINILN
jgi:hypothetical protein